MIHARRCTAAGGHLRALLWLLALGSLGAQLALAQASARRPTNNRNRFGPERPPVLRDAFLEDNPFVVRVRTTYNHTSSVACNAVLMTPHLVLSDITCIKYQGMANIDAKYVQVLAGQPNNETIYDVEQIYINKADARDPGTELALLRLARPLKVDDEWKELIFPPRNQSLEFDTPVRVIGYTSSYELKENRTRLAKRTQSNKYLCTAASDLNDTPGSQMLKGAPLLRRVDCRRVQLVGVLTRVDTVIDLSGLAVKRHQDCYVMVASQMKWYDQVRSLTDSLDAKTDRLQATEPSVMVVTVNDKQDE